MFKEYREDNNLLQKDIADYLGLPTTTYATYEQGKAEADYHTLIKLSKLYKISINQLLGDRDADFIFIPKSLFDKMQESIEKNYCFAAK